MKTKLFTTLAATAGLLLAGFIVNSQAGPSESAVHGQAASKAAVTIPASCHAPAKADADHCAVGDTCDHAAKDATTCDSHNKTCAVHGNSAVAMNCPMHAKMMKGCGAGGCH